MTVDIPRTTGTAAPAAPPTARRTRRRRRPTGAAPPLPRHLGTSGTAWLVAAGIALVVMVIGAWAERGGRENNQGEYLVLAPFRGPREAWLVKVGDAIDRVASGW